MKAVANGDVDIVQLLLSILERTGSDYCVIGGLAVNAYAEPVVSLDLDLVVVSDRLGDVVGAARANGMKVETFEHSTNLSIEGSDLRIQLQTDPRYQGFLAGRRHREVLGYGMWVASLDDVVRGKVWAYSDPTRRRSKRQKDLSDLLRLVESHPRLLESLPPDIRGYLD